MNNFINHHIQSARAQLLDLQWWLWHRSEPQYHRAGCDDSAIHHHVRSTVVDACIDEAIVELIDLINLNGISTNNSCESSCNRNLIRHAHKIDLYFRSPNDLGGFLLLMAAHHVDLIPVRPLAAAAAPGHGTGAQQWGRPVLAVTAR